MNQIKSIEASKVSPTFLIGNSLLLETRDLKFSKKPPKLSHNCNARFYEYIAKDNSTITLLETYEGDFCKDIINENFLSKCSLKNIELKDLIITKKDTQLSGSKIVIYTSQKKVKTEVINLTGRHKSQRAKINCLTLCFLELEQTGILNSKLLPNFKELRLNQKPNLDGRLTL